MGSAGRYRAATPATTGSRLLHRRPPQVRHHRPLRDAQAPSADLHAGPQGAVVLRARAALSRLRHAPDGTPAARSRSTSRCSTRRAPEPARRRGLAHYLWSRTAAERDRRGAAGRAHRRDPARARELSALAAPAVPGSPTSRPRATCARRSRWRTPRRAGRLFAAPRLLAAGAPLLRARALRRAAAPLPRSVPAGAGAGAHLRRLQARQRGDRAPGAALPRGGRHALRSEPVEANPTVRARSQRLHELVHAVSVGRGPASRAVKATSRRSRPGGCAAELLYASVSAIVFDAPADAAADEERLMRELRVALQGRGAGPERVPGPRSGALWGYDDLGCRRRRRVTRQRSGAGLLHRRGTSSAAPRRCTRCSGVTRRSSCPTPRSCGSSRRSCARATASRAACAQRRSSSYTALFARRASGPARRRGLAVLPDVAHGRSPHRGGAAATRASSRSCASRRPSCAPFTCSACATTSRPRPTSPGARARAGRRGGEQIPRHCARPHELLVLRPRALCRAAAPISRGVCTRADAGADLRRLPRRQRGDGAPGAALPGGGRQRARRGGRGQPFRACALTGGCTS